jgi:hypothetical protein
VFSAVGQTEGKKISDYPNTKTVAGTWLFIVAQTGVTNYNINYNDLASQMFKTFSQLPFTNATFITIYATTNYSTNEFVSIQFVTNQFVTVQNVSTNNTFISFTTNLYVSLQYVTNQYVTTNYTFQSFTTNLTVQKLTVQYIQSLTNLFDNLTVTNSVDMGWAYFPGPTNSIDFGHGRSYYIITNAVNLAVTNVLNIPIAGFERADILSVTNSTGSDQTLYITASRITTDDGARSYVITNKSQRKFSFLYDDQGLHCVSRPMQ